MQPRLRFLVVLSLGILLLNSILLWAFPNAPGFNTFNVLLHVVLGAVVGVLAIWCAKSDVRMGWTILAAISGVVLAVVGNTHDHKVVLLVHVVLSMAGVAVLFARREHFRLAGVFSAIAAITLLAGAGYKYWYPHPEDHITNSLVVPLTMNEEGPGPSSPFFPSAANTNTGKTVPADYFMESKKCGECHKDIYNQWKSSMHHFSSFNNQYYRKSIEYMQDVVGTKPSKWCAGCHDHAVFFNGRFDRPIKEQIDTPEAQAGLSCMSCHSIVHVNGTAGNGGMVMEYPPLHEVVKSNNPFVNSMERFVTYAAPEAHRQVFMKPFMKNNSEFCSTCHKVHLDVPLNSYRWLRGLNEYDNWQGSGVSGQGARSFYYPAKPVSCAGCHMPLVNSQDPGNINGKVHSHTFPGANTAVPTATGDNAQLKAETAFLQSGFVTVDIFAVSPVAKEKPALQMLRRATDTPQTATGFAVGEESDQSVAGVIRQVGQVAAPANLSNVTLQPGNDAQVDVVVRTRKVGHFFPGGTVDSNEVWLELEATDDAGKPIFWSGRVDDNGKGPVEPGAHFYRAVQLDALGNTINKRNAWQMRSLMYAHLIGPGSADVAHFLIHVPTDAKGTIHFKAKLNYRKFNWYYSHFAFAGQAKPGQSKLLLTKDFNSLEYGFDTRNIPKNVSSVYKDQIPDLPIVMLGQADVDIPVSNGAPVWNAVTKSGTRERWNDWGIGLLQQGDLKGAEFAFKKAAEAEPGYADAWLNAARALIQEGETDAAKPYIEKALQCDSSLGRIYYFRALIEKADGRYDDALASLKRVETQYPRDRVVLNQIARILFLKRDYDGALDYCNRVCMIDTEDLQMHYTAMLCYRGKGQADKADRELKLFQRFKADEASQALTASRRLSSPEDNNERQLVHVHESVQLPKL